MNTDALLKKAASGKLTEGECQDVVSALRGKLECSNDRYDLLLIIGKAGATKYEDLVATYLKYRSDPLLVRLALQILCDYWGLSAKYIVSLREFCKKAEWDVEDDVRLAAISSAGEFLRENDDHQLLALLLDTFGTEEDPIVKNAAYSALARSMGREWSDIPSPKSLLSEGFFDESVIEGASLRLQSSA
jgi:hypothetical protein